MPLTTAGTVPLVWEDILDKVIVIAGPTASGKTDLAIELAQSVGGEIISADSMQIYKEMSIGTAKPTSQEMSGIPHHIIDIVNPDEEFSVAQFQSLANKCICEILKRGKVPIVAGGTGLYINSLIYNIIFSEIATDWEYRDKLQRFADEKGAEALHDMLRKIDEKSADAIHPNNVKRVIRALEVYETTGKPISEHQAESRKKPSVYDFKVFGIFTERDILCKRIDDRVDRMMEMGLYEEVDGILKKGYAPSLVSLQGIGYKEIISAIAGECKLKEAIEMIKIGTRQLAKKQMTWFNKTEGLNWMQTDVLNRWAMLKILTDALNIKA